MFTGIIEALGRVEWIEKQGDNLSLGVSSPISQTLKVDQSLAHNGVCLTVESVQDKLHQVTAIAETLSKTNLQNLQVGDWLNLERCLILNGRIDGHIVQGHVDTTAVCTSITPCNGSWECTFEFDEAYAALVIEKGSIAVNGTSLTCFEVSNQSFKVAIIPYTFEHTIFKYLKAGDIVNLEFDLIGKYINRWKDLTANNK